MIDGVGIDQSHKNVDIQIDRIALEIRQTVSHTLSGAAFPDESLKLRLPQRFPSSPQVQCPTQASEGLLPRCQVVRLFLSIEPFHSGCDRILAIGKVSMVYQRIQLGQSMLR